MADEPKDGNRQWFRQMGVTDVCNPEDNQRNSRQGQPSPGYAYLHEGLTVIADQAPGLSSVLPAANMAGYAHVNIDGTLIETDRCRTPGPTPGVDLWWSGNTTTMAAMSRSSPPPDGWPLWTSPVRPCREHDTTALRSHDILPLLSTWTDDDLRVFDDLGYEGEQATVTVAFKKPKNRSWAGWPWPWCAALSRRERRRLQRPRRAGRRQ